MSIEDLQKIVVYREFFQGVNSFKGSSNALSLKVTSNIPSFYKKTDYGIFFLKTNFPRTSIKNFKKSSVYRKPFCSLNYIENSLKLFCLQKNFQRYFVYRTPYRGLLFSENILKGIPSSEDLSKPICLIYNTSNTFSRPSAYFHLETFCVQETSYRPSSLKDSLIGLFQKKKNSSV